MLLKDTKIEIHELLALLDRRQPLAFAVPALQSADREIIRSSEICLHLLLKVRERIKLEILIETLVVVPVRTFHFSVMPGSPWLDQLMLNAVLFAELVQGGKFIQARLARTAPAVAERQNLVTVVLQQIEASHAACASAHHGDAVGIKMKFSAFSCTNR